MWRIRALWRVSTQNPRGPQAGAARVQHPSGAFPAALWRGQRLTADIPVAVHGMTVRAGKRRFVVIVPFLAIDREKSKPGYGGRII